MGSFDELTDDHARTEIPAERRVSGFRVGLILVSMVITVPAFLAGAEIGQALGFTDALIVFAAAGLLIASFGALTGYVGAENGLSTSMIIRISFGERGALAVNTVLAMGTLGWFGVTAKLFGDAMFQSITALGFTGLGSGNYLTLGILLMVVTTIFGFKALDKLALLTVPVMLAFLAMTTWLSLKGYPTEAILSTKTSELSIGLAISAAAGGLMVAVAIMPDLCRYARNGRQAVFASFMAFALGWPIIMLLAAVPSIVSGERDLMVTITKLGIGLPGLGLLLLATWTTNANNLYSSSLILAAIVKRVAKWKLAIVGGMIGAVVALSGIVNQFISFLLILGVVIPPIAAIYVFDYFVLRRNTYGASQSYTNKAINLSALIAWLTASSVGLVSTYGEFSLSGIPAVDSMTIAALVYAGLEHFLDNKRND